MSFHAAWQKTLDDERDRLALQRQRGFLAAAVWYMEQSPQVKEPDYSLALCAAHNINLSDLSMGITALEKNVSTPLLLEIKDVTRMKAAWHAARRAKGEPLTLEEVMGIAYTCKEMETTHDLFNE